MTTSLSRFGLAVVCAIALAACSPSGPDSGGNDGDTGGSSGSSGGSSGSSSGRSSLTWELSDGCSDGLGLYVRFFDEDGGGAWPSFTEVYTTSAGGTVNRTLSCTTGNKVCYGAKPSDANSTKYWGVGINNDAGCDSCCVTCQTGTTQRTLTCG